MVHPFSVAASAGHKPWSFLFFLYLSARSVSVLILPSMTATFFSSMSLVCRCQSSCEEHQQRERGKKERGERSVAAYDNHPCMHPSIHPLVSTGVCQARPDHPNRPESSVHTPRECWHCCQLFPSAAKLVSRIVCPTWLGLAWLSFAFPFSSPPLESSADLQ